MLRDPDSAASWPSVSLIGNDRRLERRQGCANERLDLRSGVHLSMAVVFAYKLPPKIYGMFWKSWHTW